MLTKLKKEVQNLLLSVAEAAKKIGLTPNVISLLGISLSLLSALTYAVWAHQRYLILFAGLLLFLSGLCDALDGVLARTSSMTTPFGGFLDSMLDRYADAFVYAGIMLGGLCDVLWGSIALIGSFLVSYSRAKAEAAGIQMESIGVAERAERMLILIISSILAVLWQPILVMNISIIVLAFLSNITVLQRSLHVYKELLSK